jgi:hypothetical protein
VSATLQSNDSVSNTSVILVTTPGICTTGTYFSSHKSVSISFSSTNKSFFQMNNFDDKCFVFTASGNKNVSVSFETTSFGNRFSIFRDGILDTSFDGGSISKLIEFDDIPIFNFQTSRGPVAFDFKIQMYSDSSIDEEHDGIFIPKEKNISCESDYQWYSNGFVIFVIDGSVVLLFIYILLVINHICCKRS